MSDYELFDLLTKLKDFEFSNNVETKTIFGEYLNEADQKRIKEFLNKAIDALN